MNFSKVLLYYLCKEHKNSIIYVINIYIMKYYYVDKQLFRNVKKYIDDHYDNPGFDVSFYNILLGKLAYQPITNEDFIRTHINFINIICNWCEKEAIYDKLSKYNDFYYKLKNLTR